ncbi:NmrA-like family domain-containing protein [Colletotrichum sp. SAR11_57]|nr:NmrA-like family domain-containing protein [Colletotrichum sp. SAR11_57]
MDANTLKIVAFRVRVISRDPSSAKAKKLIDSGIDVVQADCWETGQLIEAFKGCWGVFINIDSDAPNFKQRIGPSELQMGKGIVDAAVKAGIKHAVHASLPAASELTKGQVPVLAFDVTGKPARYKEVKTGGLSAADEFKTKEVNGLFDLMHAIKGNFFNGVPTENEHARLLKKATAEARQSNISLKPMTLEQFFQKYAT